MIKMWLAFFIVFALFYFGIAAFRATTGKDKWQLTKTLTYSMVCAILTLSVLVGIVVLF